jgi:hypothetical protein
MAQIAFDRVSKWYDHEKALHEVSLAFADDVTQLFSLRENAIAKEPGSS